MLLKWLDARDAASAGVALADDCVVHEHSGSGREGAHRGDLQQFMQRFLQGVDRHVRSLSLNVFKRAKLANAFKWRLLEKGVERGIVEELTRVLVLRLTSGPAAAIGSAEQRSRRSAPRDVPALLASADQCFARGDYDEAIAAYQGALHSDPRNAPARNSLGAALSRVGRYREAEEQFRQAIGIRANYPEPHFSLGTLLRWRGQIIESEMPLRRALKLKPTHLEAQVSLAMTLMMLGRLRDARDLLEKALRAAPRHVDALLGLGQLSGREGRFAEAEDAFKRALEVDARSPAGWVGLAGLRRLTAADATWIKGAEQSAASGLSPLAEASIRFAIGKYYDEIGDFKRAFASYERANELMRTAAEPYDREARVRTVDQLMRTYTGEALTSDSRGSSPSELPVLVVGMPRAGTSLMEQIIASHPAVRGAGELPFWSQAVYKHAALLTELPGEALRRQLAGGYLRALSQPADARRVVDKSPFNLDYLGLVHAVFPRARVIYMRRNPIDTCLSCYFQEFPPALNFTLDLSDLAHHYRQHERLLEHWRQVLPAGALLEVPYEELIGNREACTRRIIEFLGLPWDPRCLDYPRTERPVLTASYWQVRQNVYTSSVGRWRHYEKFIAPLLSLRSPA